MPVIKTPFIFFYKVSQPKAHIKPLTEVHPVFEIQVTLAGAFSFFPPVGSPMSCYEHSANSWGLLQNDLQQVLASLWCYLQWLLSPLCSIWLELRFFSLISPNLLTQSIFVHSILCWRFGWRNELHSNTHDLKTGIRHSWVFGSLAAEDFCLCYLGK